MSGTNGLRFSLRLLLIVVAVVALGAFALRSASLMWVGAAVTLTLGVLLIAVLAAIYRQGAARAFWVGFAVCGWGYMLCVFGPLQTASTHLLTTRLLYYASEQTAPTAGSTYGGYGVAPPMIRYAPNSADAAPVPPAPSGVRVVPPSVPTGVAPIRSLIYQTSFMHIGQALWALLFGFVGGVVACVLYSRRQAVEA